MRCDINNPDRYYQHLLEVRFIVRASALLYAAKSRAYSSTSVSVMNPRGSPPLPPPRGRLPTAGN